MDPDRLLRVMRARGVEAALTAEPTRKDCAVNLDQHDERQTDRRPGRPHDATDGVHRRSTRARVSNSSNSVTRSWVFTPRIAARATSTTSLSSPARGASCCHAARRTRRARFRTTAPPTRRPATNATSPEPGATKATTLFPWDRRPSSSTRETWERCREERRSAREPGAVLGTTAGDDRAPGAGPHPHAEPVRLLAPPVVRLERSLGHPCLEFVGEPLVATAVRRVYVSHRRSQTAVSRRHLEKDRQKAAARARVEKPGAIFRRAFPRPGPAGTMNLPQRVSTPVERCCGSLWPLLPSRACPRPQSVPGQA